MRERQGQGNFNASHDGLSVEIRLTITGTPSLRGIKDASSITEKLKEKRERQGPVYPARLLKCPWSPEEERRRGSETSNK